jgi:hypothetical protein
MCGKEIKVNPFLNLNFIRESPWIWRVRRSGDGSVECEVTMEVLRAGDGSVPRNVAS